RRRVGGARCILHHWPPPPRLWRAARPSDTIATPARSDRTHMPVCSKSRQLLSIPVVALVGVCGIARAQESVAPPANYKPVVCALEPFIRHETEVKQLPALSIALVDDQQVVWAAGFGFRDPQEKIPATPATVYRVGSVSKLLTDLAVMKLAEQVAL